jgi:hypothetical protein
VKERDNKIVKVLFSKPEGKGHRSTDSRCNEQRDYEGAEWTNLAQSSVQEQARKSAVMDIFHEALEIYE